MCSELRFGAIHIWVQIPTTPLMAMSTWTSYLTSLVLRFLAGGGKDS